jgi:PKD repeat protein
MITEKGDKMRITGYAVLILSAIIALFSCGDNDATTGPANTDPIASFTESGEPVTPATIVFLNNSQNANAYLWRFGDGDSTTITNPTHTYNEHGNYLVSLTAKNTATNRSNTMTRMLEITPGKVFISAIRIDDIPFTDQYGSGWDLTTGPDVFPNFVTSSTVVFTLRSNYILDVSPSDLPIQWNLAQHFQIPSWSTTYFIDIWDYDDLGDDYIGYSNGFRINDVVSTSGYVSSVQRQNSSGTIRTTVMLDWE